MSKKSPGARSLQRLVRHRWCVHMAVVCCGLFLSCHIGPIPGALSVGAGMLLGEALTRQERIWREARAFRFMCELSGHNVGEVLASAERIRASAALTAECKTANAERKMPNRGFSNAAGYQPQQPESRSDG